MLSLPRPAKESEISAASVFRAGPGRLQCFWPRAAGGRWWPEFEVEAQSSDAEATALNEEHAVYDGSMG